jgi:glycosyltransferase involved in cell wall biosynthesis
MAMGKAVIAIDNPTMNEYIEDGKNGYLFSLKHPKEIDLSNIEQVQKNTYNFMNEGYKKWDKDRHSVIDFFKKS